MLNKVKVGVLVGLALQLVKAFVPDLPLPEDVEGPIADVVWMTLKLLVELGILGSAMWLTPETKATVAGLKTKRVS